MVPCSCHTGAFIVSPLLCEWPYLVQRSIWVVLLREAGGHHIPLVTLENATSFGYFWHQGWREGTSYMHLKDTRKMHPSSSTHPHFHSPSQPLSPSLQHLLSRSITHCTTDIQHYSRVKAIFFLRWIPTHLLTWCELWRHSFVMSLEAFVCFSVIGDEAHRQAVCKWHQRLGLGEATIFTYKTTKNMV